MILTHNTFATELEVGASSELIFSLFGFFAKQELHFVTKFHIYTLRFPTMEKIEHEVQAVETPRSTALETWLADYLRHKADQCDSSSYPVSDVASDEIDVDAIEMRVKQLMKDIHVTAGFCSRCSHLLQHWPNLSRNIDWDYAVGQKYNTEEVEAASRLGCKLCAFLWTGLIKDNSVSICRKIEARLAALHNPARSALTIQNWGTLNDTENRGSQLLWWNYPGKEATHCNMVGARLFKFESQLLSPESKQTGRPRRRSFQNC